MLWLALAPALLAAPLDGVSREVLERPPSTPVIDASARLRAAILLGNGRDVSQPGGFGFSVAVGWHALAIGAARLGLSFEAGHNLWLDRVTRTDPDLPARTREHTSRLMATDLAIGPSVQLALSRVFVTIAARGGLSIGSLERPRLDGQLETWRAFGGVVRGEVAVGVPLARAQGLQIGVAIGQVFSPAKIPTVPSDDPAAAASKARVFDLTLDVFLGYQAWF